MARLARVVVPGLPHHVTQRGNRRLETFFGDDDYRRYLDLMAEWCGRHGVAVWAYCLMPNHVHLIAVPETEAALGRAIGEAHRRYTRWLNDREDWRGYLWQGRFASFPMDQRHLLAAARYVELNPLRAGLAQRAEAYPWSSARAHLAGRDDVLVRVAPLLELVDDWSAFLAGGLAEADGEALRRHERTGRPLGDTGFIAGLEGRLGRPLGPGKRGPKGPRAASQGSG
ncbi:MAG: transposase [Alphaproteobacteria bacterium]|jgi:putative transposase|nr:transposase [Alphaproteobacteria bacterium]MDP6564700.1 transposase [Alphaproteobacteria bacterium]MDP6815994.1 transposase [Alphaproteobacteria bacterium]